VEVVLVRPGTPANVGAVARIIRNTGLTSLVLVAPGDWRTLECWRSAWGAQEVLEQARVVVDLASALAGASFTVGFSGKPASGSLDVRDAALEIASLGTDETAALVFGPEASGLSDAELALCGRRALIPSHPDQPSLNLSQAVMVASYEVFRAGRVLPEAPRRATHAEKEKMLEQLLEGLRGIEALPTTHSSGYFREWRTLFQRADLTPKEVRLLEHMARKMAKRRES
jgi:TrmH family RNA methyltransferase